jgi:RHS repeat-associated protein
MPISAAPKSSAEAEQMLRSAWFYHPTGVQLAQLRWMNSSGGPANRRILYNSAKRPVAVYDNDQLIARYHYNSRGERIAKTVYPARPALRTVTRTQAEAQGDTTYNLYRDQRLAAETDSAGRITAHYIYLYGKPVAKIEMAANDSGAHRLWKAVTMRSEPEASDTLASIYAIVTDQLGTPQQVMDERQQAVWRADTSAFGLTRVLHAAATGAHAKPFMMNLRLPGQVFDAETKLNYNYLRDYDPEVGRYTTPDPAGLAGGFNPYSYVSNNPLTNIDPLGLYQIDIHYYMTFFLARLTGNSVQDSQTIALAAQYIDDNPNTTPIDTKSPSTQAERLALYHFTQSGFDRPKMAGQSDHSYEWSRVISPWNAQLQNLYDASNRAPKSCAKTQLFGEFLHTLEDTFAHRDRLNEPIDVNVGIGHLGYGTSPDMTYNHVGLSGYWGNNEQRTFSMEQEIFGRLISFSGKQLINSETGLPIESSGKKVTYADIFGDGYWGSGSWVSGFNTITTLDGKISYLNEKLKDFGLGAIPGYDEAAAQQRRKLNLTGINQNDNPGTILATP